MNSTQVAQTILQQLGGECFTMTTGARNLTADGNSLKMILPKTKYGTSRTARNRNIYVFAVTLTAADDYTLTLQVVRNFVPVTLETISGIYCDQLEEVFTSMTGLYTRL